MLFHAVRADFLERVRRSSFLLVIVLVAVASYAFVPPADAPYTIIDLGGARGSYNMAWIGAMLTMLVTQFVALLGFYYVRGMVAYDIHSGVGQLVGATPLPRLLYILGKWLSNWLLLSLLTGVVAFMGVVMLLGRGEVAGGSPGTLLEPLVIIALPMMALTAALATFFDAARWLRGAAGGVGYFFLFLMGLGAMMTAGLDPTGILTLSPGITAACAEIYGEVCDRPLAVGIVGVEAPLQTFLWTGMHWTPAVVAGHWLWAVVALAIAGGAALLFDGFAPSRERAKPARVDAPEPLEPASPSPSLARRQVSLSPVQPARSTFARILLAELRLLLKGRTWRWYAGALILIIATALSPLEITLRWLLPIAWIWPLLIWSELGTRERRYGTTGFISAIPGRAQKQLPATFLAAFCVTALLGAGAAVALVASGETLALLSWGATALLIPALALALGVWSSNPRLFELVYLLLWYSALNEVPGLSFAGDGPTAIGIKVLLTALLLVFAAANMRKWR